MYNYMFFETKDDTSNELLTVYRTRSVAIQSKYWVIMTSYRQQQSPAILASGPGLWKMIFPRNGVGGSGSGGNASDGEWQMKLS